MLLVDDEVRMTAALARGLIADGFTVDTVSDGPAALDQITRTRYDAVVLDIMLPGLSGYEVLKRVRARGDAVAVLMLSAKDGEYDLADALDLGADDYLVKPFSYVVLVARLHALGRRGHAQVPHVLEAGGLTLDTVEQTVRLHGDEVTLTPRERGLLAYLMAREGRTVGKSELLERVFDTDPDAHPNVVEVYVGYLRRKLGRDAVLTVRGGGYRMGTP